MDDSQFFRLLDYFNYSKKGYRKVRKGVKKRIARHMLALGCRNIDAYLGEIASDPEARAECERRMTVSISRFFRDQYLWQVVQKRLVPELMGKERSHVTVWFAGCAGGEEVYSFKILWEESRVGYAVLPELEIIATDLNPENLRRARRGTYPKGAMREVDEARLQRWFQELERGGYAIDSSLKAGIEWQARDLLTDEPPGHDLDMIFLRNNLLTYHQEDLIEKPLERIIDALRPTGFLVVGAREQMPRLHELRFTLFDRYVYRKRAR